MIRLCGGARTVLMLRDCTTGIRLSDCVSGTQLDLDILLFERFYLVKSVWIILCDVKRFRNWKNNQNMSSCLVT